MTGRARAVLFDLDDTLYRERRFILSGFRAVARSIAGADDADARRLFGTLLESLKAGRRAMALQDLCARNGWHVSEVGDLVEVIRSHRPALRLPPASRRVLEGLRPAWRLGIVTNGPAGTQRRKVAALGVAGLVDAVVFASEHGSGQGKPEREPFLAACSRLAVDPWRCVFVGDNPVCDVAGARAVGMQTILLVHGPHADREAAGAGADRVVRSIADVPRAVETLLGKVDPLCA
jgi:putative hydrolase of the HAD superfamily